MLKDYLPNDLVETIKKECNNSGCCYLVGGAIRDALLKKPVHDLDFIILNDSLNTARRIADDLHAYFYVLDPQRETGRVLFTRENGEQITLDFAGIRGESLEDDLLSRDFCINAIAADLQVIDILIDPLNGGRDLQKRILRTCSSSSFQDDPVRLMRAIRFSIDLGLGIDPVTLIAIKKAAPLLSSVSHERIRDELFRILEGSQPSVGLRLLDKLNLIIHIFPEWKSLKEIAQHPPHVHDVFEHTLAVIHHLEILLNLLTKGRQPDHGANLIQGEALSVLGKFRSRFDEHLSMTPVLNRTRKGLLFLAAALHDIGKPTAKSRDQEGGVHFYKHEILGSEIATPRMEELILARNEILIISGIVREHMRIHNLAQRGVPLTKRNIYRFFRDCGDFGVEVCLLSLADILATYEHSIPQSEWLAELGVCRTLLEAWWEQKSDQIFPKRLVDGNQLMAALDLPAGPQIGILLDNLYEAQAAGEISTKQEALSLARKMVHDSMHIMNIGGNNEN